MSGKRYLRTPPEGGPFACLTCATRTGQAGPRVRFRWLRPCWRCGFLSMCARA